MKAKRKRGGIKNLPVRDAKAKNTKGGDVKTESQTFSALQSAVSNVTKSIGDALASAARKA
jgi:hypothetical protein